MGEGFEEELVTVQPLTRGTGNDNEPTVSSGRGFGGGGGQPISNWSSSYYWQKGYSAGQLKSGIRRFWIAGITIFYCNMLLTLLINKVIKY